MLAHVFEAAGLATVALGSMRKQIERTAPPRGLLCDFPLGRPLGKPGDPEFQHRVLAHAFDLVERATEPIFEVFAESIADDGDEAQSACTLPPRHDPTCPPAVDEARGLRPAYDRAVAEYGEHAVPAGRSSADQIPDRHRGVRPGCRRHPVEGGRASRAYPPGSHRTSAATTRPPALALIEHTPAAWETTRWFLHDTEAGRAIKATQAAMEAANVNRQIWFYLAPHDI